MKITIAVSLSLVLILLVPGCITIQTVPGQSSPSSSQPAEGEPDPAVKNQPVIEDFNVSPPLIGSGGTATLSWSVSGADTVSITPGTGQLDSAGTMQVSPAESTSYTLTAVNSAGTVTRSIEVTVQPAQETFAVIKVVAGTEPSPGPCPEILYADITTNGAGTVTYRWESAGGGGYSYTFGESFTFAGTRRVTLFQDMSALPTGMYRIHILSPNDLISNTTHYTTCGP